MWNSRKTSQMSSKHSHQQNHRQEPSVRRKVRFRIRVPKVDPRHVEFTEKKHRCRTGTRTSKTTSRNRPSSPGDDKKPPQERRAHLKSPRRCVSPPGTTTRNKHYLPHHAPRAGVTQETPPIACLPTLQHRRPAWQRKKAEQKKKSADTGRGHQP